MSKIIRKSKFEYYEEDCRCEFCLYRSKKSCTRKTCCCADIRRDAIKNGRINRERGWNK